MEKEFIPDANEALEGEVIKRSDYPDEKSFEKAILESNFMKSIRESIENSAKDSGKE